jgi:hypothetical protein
MAKLRINGDSSGYVDLSAPNASSSRTIDVDQLPELNVANTFTTRQVIRTDTASGGYTAYPSLTLRNDNVNGYSVLHFNRGATTQSARIEVDNNNGSPTIGMYATSGGNGIKVDHNGAVTMPNQPCFRATNGASSIGVGVITLTQADFDVTSSYNTSNGRFTAPVTGHYLFYLTALYIVSGTSPTWKVSWWKNNNFDAVVGEYQSTLASSGYNTLFNSTVTTHMAAGDFMQVYNNGPSNVHISGTQTKFGGYLLQ